MVEKRRSKRKTAQIKEGTLAYKWTYEKRPKGLSIQGQLEEAFRALEQIKRRPETKEEKAGAIHRECQLKITELFPSAWPAYQLAGVLLNNIIQGTTIPESIWKTYRKEIESAINSGTPQVRNGTPVQPGFANGTPQAKSGTPIHQDTQPERLSLAWFERELYNAAGLLQFKDDPELRERAINWLYKLKDEATEIQKTKPDTGIEKILEKINEAIESQKNGSPEVIT